MRQCIFDFKCCIQLPIQETEDKNMNFIELLENRDYNKLLQIPKSDIHSHAGRGGNIKFISERTGSCILPPPEKYESLSHIQKWFDENIKPICGGKEGQILRWEACFAEAKRNHISRLALSFSRLDVAAVGGMQNFVEILERFHQEYCPGTRFEPELTYGRNCNIDLELEYIDELLQTAYFRSIDICNGEFQQSIHNFVPLYRKAEEYNLVKKAHVGEFGSAEDIVEAVQTLGLQEVHHGIAAANSKEVMRFLEREKVQLNICPSSNVMLKVAKNYAEHPIQTLVRSGVLVTINTDDLLIFNNSIEQEYINLYEAGTLTAQELEKVRLQGLSQNC